MRFDLGTAFDHPPNGLDFGNWNGGWLPRGGNKRVYPWSRHNVQPAVQATP
jgi:hypothetical protein